MITPKDKQLIGILKINARKSISDIARELNLARTTVQQRLNKLEENGYILGYTTKLSESLTESVIKAHVNITIDPNKNSAIVSTLATIPSIDTLFSVSGKVDLIAILSVETPRELDQGLDRISSINGVKSTETSIVLGTKFDRS